MKVCLWFVLSLSAAACETAAAPPLERDAKSDTTNDASARDTSDSETLASGYVRCDRDSEEPNGGCATGQYCETVAQVCVDCLSSIERCSDRGTFQRCEAPTVQGFHQLTGGLFHDDACSGDDVCVPNPLDFSATCEPKVCSPDPSTWRCLNSTTVEQCNAYGNEKITDECGSGKSCYEGLCQPIRHNVVIIFDTSSSMHDYIDASSPGSPQQCVLNQTPCWGPFPECDGAEPLTLFTQAKKIFADVIANRIAEWTQFALQRFPQVEQIGNTPYANNAVGCVTGWYQAARAPGVGAFDTMTGDVDDKESGPWFEENLGQVLVVPFSRRINTSNTSQILEWLDFEEAIGPSTEPCSVDADCRGGQGRCGKLDGDNRCYYHSQNELRAMNETPLGKSLFYAGEYFRRFVRVDGKACTNAVSCGSAGYECVDGKCTDPYRYCKEDHIILFTDGDENVYKDPTSFFNPEIQAKRLKYGLECNDASDCRASATCEDHECVPPGLARGTLHTLDSGGYGALSSPDGEPISVQTTVISLNTGSANNHDIARAGGGPNLTVLSTQTEQYRTLIEQALDRDPKCRPERP